MFIGKLSAESGFSKDTIRYYEKLGLIQCTGYVRHANNYKSYSTRTLHRLKHVRELKCAGFTLAEIIDMLDSFQHVDQPCTGLQTTLADKIIKLNEKITALENYKHSIQNISNACDSNCTLDDGLPSCIGR